MRKGGAKGRGLEPRADHSLTHPALNRLDSRDHLLLHSETYLRKLGLRDIEADLLDHFPVKLKPVDVRHEDNPLSPNPLRDGSGSPVAVDVKWLIRLADGDRGNDWQISVPHYRLEKGGVDGNNPTRVSSVNRELPPPIVEDEELLLSLPDEEPPIEPGERDCLDSVREEGENYPLCDHAAHHHRVNLDRLPVCVPAPYPLGGYDETLLLPQPPGDVGYEFATTVNERDLIGAGDLPDVLEEGRGETVLQETPPYLHYNLQSLHRVQRGVVETRPLVKPEHQVHRLYRISRGSLNQIVCRPERDDPPRPTLLLETDVAEIRTNHYLRVGKPEGPLLVSDDPHEVTSVVHRSVSLPDFKRLGAPAGEEMAGAEYSPDHVDRMRRHRDLHLLPRKPGENLLYLCRVAVPRRLVGPHDVVPLGEVGGERGLPARPRGADLRVDDDVLHVDGERPLLQERRESQDGGDGHASGGRNEGCAPDLFPIYFWDGVDKLSEKVGGRVVEPVPALVFAGVLQPEVGAHVNNLQTSLRQLRDVLDGLTVGEGGEDEVSPFCKRSLVELREGQVRDAAKVGMHPEDVLARVTSRSGHGEIDLRVLQ